MSSLIPRSQRESSATSLFRQALCPNEKIRLHRRTAGLLPAAHFYSRCSYSFSVSFSISCVRSGYFWDWSPSASLRSARSSMLFISCAYTYIFIYMYIFFLPSRIAVDSSSHGARLLQILVKKLKWIPRGESTSGGPPHALILLSSPPSLLVLCGRRGKVANAFSFGLGYTYMCILIYLSIRLYRNDDVLRVHSLYVGSSYPLRACCQSRETSCGRNALLYGDFVHLKDVTASLCAVSSVHKKKTPWEF